MQTESFVIAPAPAHTISIIDCAITIDSDSETVRDILRQFLMLHLPQPICKAEATSAHSIELINAALADSNTPQEQREYLLDLRERKYDIR
jgi:hypothetical protein